MDKNFKYFSFEKSGNDEIIKHTAGIKYLGFIITLFFLTILIFVAGLNVREWYFKILLVAFGGFCIYYCIYLILISINWQLKIVGKTIYIRNKMKNWDLISNIKRIKVEKSIAEIRIMHLFPLNLKNSRIIIMFNDGSEKILLTSDQTHKKEKFENKHKEFILFGNYLSDILECEFFIDFVMKSNYDENRKTLY